MTATIYTATPWNSNAELIADVEQLGYLPGTVLDPTYGFGKFWTVYHPPQLTGCDIDPEKSPIGYSVDFRKLPFGDGEFDAVVFDPPYRLNGTPDRGEFDERYGIGGKYTRWQDRHQLIREGLSECARVASAFVLLKCQDQVCSGKKRWQTFDFSFWAMTECGLYLEDRFDMLGHVRPQPAGRRQVHSQGNYSTLLVFRKASR